MSRRGGVYWAMGYSWGSVKSGIGAPSAAPRADAASAVTAAGSGRRGVVMASRARSAARARSSAPGVRRKRASWCRARIRPCSSNSICCGSVSARSWPSSTARRMARSSAACQAPHHRRQRVAHRAGPVVELDRAADVDAARVDLHRDAPHPALEQRAQPRQAARLVHGGEEHLFLEARVVLADHGDLQFLARAEVREDARLAHLRHLGQRADRQALQPHVRGQAERRVQDGGARLLALVQGLRRGRAAAAVAGGGSGRVTVSEDE